MKVVGGPEPAGAHPTSAGLVLLYAPDFTHFRPAYALDRHQRKDFTIGRDPAADIHIPEAAVSRQHVRISFRAGKWHLKDLGGKNGTLVDGELVDEVELEPLHEIRIGDAHFKFIDSGAEQHARYRIDGTVLGEGAGEDETAPRGRSGAARPVGGYQVARIAQSLERVAKSPISILILGETGTGKEVFAQYAHQKSGRTGPILALNCAALPQNLVESELFGYKRGAFSGADRDKTGIVKAADGGTLLLDEIGDLPLSVQAKLLRVLQSREVYPLGSTQPERVDVRFICATHRDLTRMREAEQFRDDLFARINEYTVVLPPLRERKEDIYALCKAFLARHGGSSLRVGFPFMTALIHHDYPFNVRELESMLKRAVALAGDAPAGAELTVDDLPDELRDRMRAYGRRKLFSGNVDEKSRSAPTEEQIRALFKLHKGNLAAVGRELGKERMQIYRWAKRYGISFEDYRE